MIEIVTVTLTQTKLNDHPNSMNAETFNTLFKDKENGDHKACPSVLQCVLWRMRHA